MKYQKQISADQNFLHDSAADVPARVNNPEDIRPPSRKCTGNRIVGGRCSDSSCEKQAREDHCPNQRLEARKNSGLQMNRGRTKMHPQREPLEERNMTRTIPDNQFTAEELRRLDILREASGDPPITEETLSELGLPRIVSDARLRHDINFDREVSFKANMFGEVGRRKRASEAKYWEALKIELGDYTAHRPSDGSAHCTFSHRQLGSELLPRRLPTMFQTIQKILKTLVPPEEWPTVDERLDIDLLMQQLEKGVCDIVALSKWLSVLMLGSCSPLRDSLIESIVPTIQEGVDNDNVGEIVDGLRRLFHALEMMKLDVANHQIRYLRLLMVGDFVSYEQKVFLQRIPKESNLRNACSWFESRTEAEADNCLRAPQLSTFINAVIELVVSNHPHYPSTFEYDFDRLRLLQLDFQNCLTQAACSQAFIECLVHMGHDRLPSTETITTLHLRICSLTAAADSRSDLCEQANAVALEIVRACYSICGYKSIPSASRVDSTERRVLECWTPSSPAFHELELTLKADFALLIDEEVKTIKSMDPIEILSYLNPGPSPAFAPSRSPRSPREHFLSYQEFPWGRSEHLEESLVNMAKRTAHIAILHWRVWLPILYEEPWLRQEQQGQEQSGARRPRSRSDALRADETGQRRYPFLSPLASPRRSELAAPLQWAAVGGGIADDHSE